jgi:hypothetical protein
MFRRNPLPPYVYRLYPTHSGNTSHTSWLHLQVSEPFEIDGKNVKPISLPAQGENPADGATATVIGWGRLQVSVGQHYLCLLSTQFLVGHTAVKAYEGSWDKHVFIINHVSKLLYWCLEWDKYMYEYIICDIVVRSRRPEDASKKDLWDIPVFQLAFHSRTLPKRLHSLHIQYIIISNTPSRCKFYNGRQIGVICGKCSWGWELSNLPTTGNFLNWKTMETWL